MTIKRLACPSCHFTKFEHDQDDNLVCQACGTIYESPREEIFCLSCGTINPSQAKLCKNCGLNLGKVCPNCDHQNEPGIDHCVECGTPLDVLAIITNRFGEGKEASLQRTKERLVNTKKQDAIFMAQERARIDAEEQERRAQIQFERDQKQKRVRRIIFIVGTSIVLFILATLGCAYILSLVS